MARPYQELRDKMSPERRARIGRRVQREVLWISLCTLGLAVVDLLSEAWNTIHIHTSRRK